MPKIIDKRDKPSPFSKAFGVNARTLSLLEGTDATDLFLKNGRRMEAINIYRNTRLLVRNEFSSVKHKYPFMLIQSQADSEAILENLLQKRGIVVERGLELSDVQLKEDSIQLEAGEGKGSRNFFETDFLFAADGAHSFVRRKLNISFDGTAYEEPWQLYDIELETNLNKDEAHAFVLDSGALFLVRIHENIWRIIGNLPQTLDFLPAGTEVGNVHWQSEFTISHRMVGTFRKGKVFLGGDAAHIHSGLGARGMNMGIEDAYVFSKLFSEGALENYDAQRSKAVKDTIENVQRLTDMMRGKSAKSRLFRQVAPVLLPFLFPFIKKSIQSFLLGIDHEV